jgi:hypothetical protein
MIGSGQFRRLALAAFARLRRARGHWQIGPNWITAIISLAEWCFVGGFV